MECNCKGAAGTEHDLDCDYYPPNRINKLQAEVHRLNEILEEVGVTAVMQAEEYIKHRKSLGGTNERI